MNIDPVKFRENCNKLNVVPTELQIGLLALVNATKYNTAEYAAINETWNIVGEINRNGNKETHTAKTQTA